MNQGVNQCFRKTAKGKVMQSYNVSSHHELPLMDYKMQDRYPSIVINLSITNKLLPETQLFRIST